MSDNKKYYYLKLKEDFFTSETITLWNYNFTWEYERRNYVFQYSTKAVSDEP